MQLFIVSGLSGAGKTTALRTLEDNGVYCIDNLPVNLLPALARQATALQETHNYLAVGVDARTITLHDMPVLMENLQTIDVPYKVLFLEADEAALLKRFSETRRKHPLTKQDLSLAEAIRHERQLLAALADCADIRIDSSQMHVHQLRDTVLLKVGLDSKRRFSLLFQSFGFKYGVPTDLDFVFDVRCLPNPHWHSELRPLTGCDVAVAHFLQQQPKVQQMQRDMIAFLETWIPEFIADKRSYLTIAIGCTGGQHRSVYFAEQLAAHFRQQDSPNSVLVRHRELL